MNDAPAPSRGWKLPVLGSAIHCAACVLLAIAAFGSGWFAGPTSLGVLMLLKWVGLSWIVWPLFVLLTTRRARIWPYLLLVIEFCVIAMILYMEFLLLVIGKQ